MKKLNDKNEKMNFINKVWQLLKPFHKDLYFILIIRVFFETIRMGGPFLFGKILDLLIKSRGLITTETALFVVGGLAGVRLISLIIDHLTDWFILRFLIKSEDYVSASAYQKMVELSLDYHEEVPTGKKINLINRGTDKLLDLVEGFTFEFQPVVIQLVVTSIMILLTNWVIGLIFTLSLLPFILITFHIFESTSKLRERRHNAYEQASGIVGDTMTNITVVKGFAQEETENEAYGSVKTFITDVFMKEFQGRVYKSLGRNVLIEIFYILLLVIGLFEIRINALTVGSLVFLINLIERAYSNIYRLGRIYQRIAEAKEPVNDLTNLMQSTSTIKNPENAVRVDKLEGEIGFQNVTFAYNKRSVLRNVSFTIPAGSFTALVGRSGSG